MDAERMIEELANGPAVIRSLLNGVTQVQSQVQPDPESWSILEVVCHLYDEECEDFRPRLKIILLRPKESWSPISPQAWVGLRKYNEQDLMEMLAKFLEERTASIKWLRGLTSPDWEAGYSTPFGTLLKAGDMLSAWVAHDNLHTRQLVELRRNRLVRLADPYRVEYAGDW